MPYRVPSFFRRCLEVDVVVDAHLGKGCVFQNPKGADHQVPQALVEGLFEAPCGELIWRYLQIDVVCIELGDLWVNYSHDRVLRLYLTDQLLSRVPGGLED